MSWTASNTGKVRWTYTDGDHLRSLRAQQRWSSRADDHKPKVGHRLLFLHRYCFFHLIRSIYTQASHWLHLFTFPNNDINIFLAVWIIRASTVVGVGDESVKG